MLEGGGAGLHIPGHRSDVTFDQSHASTVYQWNPYFLIPRLQQGLAASCNWRRWGEATRILKILVLCYYNSNKFVIKNVGHTKMRLRSTVIIRTPMDTIWRHSQVPEPQACPSTFQ